MPKRLSVCLISGGLFLAPLTVFAGAFLFFSIANHHLKDILGAPDSSAVLFSAPPPLLGGVSQSFVAGDARALLVERFLQTYRSPIQGSGSFMVEMADKYKIDWRLVPAIAFQESNLGRVIPKGSYNAWGWAIFTGQDSGSYFSSWKDAIEKVSRGLSQDYYARGLTTPQQIQTRYAPNSDGSWASAVQSAISEIDN